MNTKVAGTFWRAAGMSYLQYLGTASAAVRNALKEPARSKAMSRANVMYNKTVGSSSDKVAVNGFIGK